MYGLRTHGYEQTTAWWSPDSKLLAVGTRPRWRRGRILSAPSGRRSRLRPSLSLHRPQKCASHRVRPGRAKYHGHNRTESRERICRTRRLGHWQLAEAHGGGRAAEGGQHVGWRRACGRMGVPHIYDTPESKRMPAVATLGVPHLRAGLERRLCVSASSRIREPSAEPRRRGGLASVHAAPGPTCPPHCLWAGLVECARTGRGKGSTQDAA